MQSDDLQSAVLEVLGCPHALKLGGWVKMDNLLAGLAARHGIRPKSETQKAREALERIVREAMSNSGGKVLSNSSQGYKLTALATEPEVDHAVADLHSRANNHRERADEIRAAWFLGRDPATREPVETLC